jgi:hypothetical protein
MAPQVPVKTRTVTYPLANANQALDDLRHGRIEGAAVLVSAPLVNGAAGETVRQPAPRSV